MQTYSCARLVLWGFLALQAARVGAEDTEPETAAESNKTRFGYLLVIPKIIESGSKPLACISLHNIREDVGNINVTVRLHNSKDSLNYWASQTTMGHQSTDTCFAVSVPEVTGKQMKLAAITVELFDLGDDLGEFSSKAIATKKLMMRPADFTIYINTDKPIYKPGQNVLFRILQLRGLYPTSHEITKVTIVDPKDRKLQVFANLIPNKGLVSENFQLIAEPTFGTWKIQVECAGKKMHTTFKVEEYVLPKYEVTIETPKFLHVESGNFTVKVCGRYTYGKPVRGKVLVKLEVKAHWYYFRSSRPSQRLRAKTDETGCVVVIGDPSVMEFRNRDFHFHRSRLQVTANLTEDFTGVELSGKNTDCELTTSPYVISVGDYPTFYKPGLPWNTAVNYADVSGSPIPDRTLTARITTYLKNGNTSDRYVNTTTDKQGNAPISVDTMHSVRRYNIEVHDPSIPAWDYNWWTEKQPLKIRRSSAYIRIMRAFSPSFSFAAIDRIPKSEMPLQCTQELQLAGRAVVTFSLGDIVEKPQVFYKITSRNKIIDEGVAEGVTLEECAETPYQLNSVETLVLNTCKMTFRTNAVVNSEWAPTAEVMMFFVKLDGEVVADDLSLSVGDCFKNQASIEFDSESVRPGDRVALTLTAEPHSLCALSIVDKSVHLLGGDNSFTADKVSSELKKRSQERIEYVEREGCDYTDFQYRYRIDENDVVTDRWARFQRRRRSLGEDFEKRGRRQKRSVYYPYDGYRDAFASFKKLDLLFLTNLRIHLMDCDDIFYHPIAYAMDVQEGGSPFLGVSPRGPLPENGLARVASVSDDSPSPSQKSIESIEVRNYFPETWKWELVDVGDNGTAALANQEMPDTITEWVATSYCVSETAGVGVANVATVKGFKPVFLSMTLPYSVVRGEEVRMKASLFNYLKPDTCLEMVISLEKTDDFEILDDGEPVFYKCLCGGESVGINFDIRPLTLGEITFTMRAWSRDGHICGKGVSALLAATDGVERTLIVEAEGIEEETTMNDFLCVEDGGSSIVTQNLEVPEDTFEGSARVLVNVIGSIMGPVMENLNHLIRVPYGCGEQNMVTMVPNIVVMKYLAATGKLTPELEKRIKSNILLGYQRQLNYQRKDGSFSAFGDNDSSGSTWLTAFVISTFEQAKEFIFVDDNILISARGFLAENTDENGCVKKVGMVHNKRMMGGAEGTNALNEYVSLALYTPNDPVEPMSTADVTGCDGNAELKLYTTAIKFYANALKGKYDAAKLLWSTLQSKATFSNGDTFEEARSVFWSDMAPEEEDDSTPSWWYYRKPSDAVEVTGYVLLGYLKMEEEYEEEFPIEKGYAIVQWLTSQRNCYGGWSSTQNTIIGLTALAAYAKRTYIMDTELSVQIGLPDGELANGFQINDDESLSVKQSVIGFVPSSLTYEATGRGCALVQTNVRYNVPRKEPDPSFTISTIVQGMEKGCGAPGQRLLVVCATYQGTHEQPVSNMAVFEIKLVSGYSAVKESLEKMAKANKFNGLKRYELGGKKVTIYFRAIGSSRKCAAFEVAYEEGVKNPQPGTARVYDYYDPVKEATTAYNLSCRWENYDPKNFNYDCMQWNKRGYCDKACSSGRADDGFCASVIQRHHVRYYDYCNWWGDRNCGDSGVCITTTSYYRCQCGEGWKESRWGGRCIDENEEEPDITPILEPLESSPDCFDEVCPEAAQILRSGSNTTYFCTEGYSLVGNDSKSYCEDIDECISDPCDSNTLECLNSPGSYTCSCKDGYTPYIDLDENVIEVGRCTAIEGEGDEEEDDEEDENREHDGDDDDDDDDDDDEEEEEEDENHEGEDNDDDDVDDEKEGVEEEGDEDHEGENDVDDEDEEEEGENHGEDGAEEDDEKDDGGDGVANSDDGFGDVGEESNTDGGENGDSAKERGVDETPFFEPAPLVPVPRVEVPVLAVPQAPGEMKASCPVCLQSFPKPSEYQGVFCPRVNVYVITNSGSMLTLRAIVRHGKPVYEERIKNIQLHMDPTCVCDNLQGQKSMMMTPYDPSQSPDGNSIIIDGKTRITRKRAWKKVQNLVCKGDTTSPDPGEELTEEAPETSPVLELVPELISVPKIAKKELTEEAPETSPVLELVPELISDPKIVKKEPK